MITLIICVTREKVKEKTRLKGEKNSNGSGHIKYNECKQIWK